MTCVHGTIVVPELQNYYTKFISRGTLNKNQIPRSVRICESFMSKNSFIRLLFDDDWPDIYKSYRYLYREDNNVGGWPSIIRERTMVYPLSTKYYASDSDSTAVCNINAFVLTNNDLVLLDALLKYRLTDSTSLIVIDSTSVTDPIFIDSTSADTTAVLTVNFNTLTRFSKLVFLFLNLEVNGDITLYNNTTLISDPDSVLESTYESYVLEKMFSFIAARGT